METVTVRDTAIPKIGIGTFKLEGQACSRVVEDALELGYRHVDTAEFYENQADVGKAIETAAVDRDDIFLTTKVWKSNLAYEDVLESAATSLEALGTEYVDLLLIHWPNEDVPIEETIGAMNQLQAEGLVRHIGVSNFSRSQLIDAMDASRTPLLTNQVEYNPYTDQSALAEFCAESEMALTAYSPLAKGHVLGDELLEEIGERYGKSESQVALRWLIQQESVVAIPKASSREHLRDNLDVFDFELTPEEMDRLFEHRQPLVSRVREVIDSVLG